jgi:hypothetical protein
MFDLKISWKRKEREKKIKKKQYISSFLVVENFK